MTSMIVPSRPHTVDSPIDESDPFEQAFDDEMEITFEEELYFWNGEMWYRRRDNRRAPDHIALKLNELTEDIITRLDDHISSPRALLDQAMVARDAKQYQRALHLLRRCLEWQPWNTCAAAVLSSIQREIGNPILAIQMTEPFKDSDKAPILTTRAAALCDLGQYEEALDLVKRAIAVGSSGPHAFAVRSRIKSACPKLFPTC